MKALSGEQAQHFLAVAKDDQLEALYVLALTTGMREGELLGLKWEDVDFERKKVQVRRTISRIPHQGFQSCRAENPEEPEEHPPDEPGARVAVAPSGATERSPALCGAALE